MINRNQSHGEELVQTILEHTEAKAAYLPWDRTQPVPTGTDILINATPMGFAPNVTAKPDIDYDTITPNMTVSDVVFNPDITEFLKAAAVRGAKTVSGLGMLVCQGALNFTIWTGREAPYDVMYQALKKRIRFESWQYVKFQLWKKPLLEVLSQRLFQSWRSTNK